MGTSRQCAKSSQISLHVDATYGYDSHMPWVAEMPYNELPLLPPRDTVETRAILKTTIEARAGLAALDQAARRMPNPAVLLSVIPLLEAQASSEIENIVTTTDDLFRFAEEDAGSASPEVKETLQYRSALFQGLRSLRDRPISPTTAALVCSTITRYEMTIRQLPGTMIANPVSRRPIYTPPSGQRVIREKLDNWAQFVNDAEELDPLVAMAVAHYQFEAIHPFADGNGRTGRILNILHLVDRGLISEPILYLSRYLIAHRSDYYRLLLAVTREGAWEDWILFMLDAVRQTSRATLRKIDEIQRLQSSVREAMRSTVSGANSDLLDLLFEQPYARIANVMKRCGVSRPTATKRLNELVELGVLRDVRLGRERLFINADFLALLMREDTGIDGDFDHAPSRAGDPTLF